MSSSALAVVAVFDGRTELLDAFVRRAVHESMILLLPEHDSARRLLHGLQFEGYRVHVVERSVRLPEERALAELAVTAAHYLQARWIVPLRLDEVLSSSGALDGRALQGDVLRSAAPPACDPDAAERRAIVRTTTLPGPAHKEFVPVTLRPGLPYSVLLDLHVPMYTTGIAVTIEDAGCATIAVDALRTFRRGAPPSEVDPLDLSRYLGVAGPAMLVPPPPLEVFAVNGSAEFVLNVPAIWAAGPQDAIELRITAGEPAESVLSTELLDALGAAYRDPWFAIEPIVRALDERTARA